MLKRQTIPIREVYAGMYDGPHATPKPSESGPIFLGIKNVGENGQLDLSDVRHISEAEYPRWIKRVEPKHGDIVFSYEATLNRYAIIPKGFRGCLGRRMALIRPNESKTNGKYLYYYFFSQEWRNVIAQNTLVGSTVDRIPIAKFPDFPIAVCPLPTQRKIAVILSAYDELIGNNLRRIKILEEMAQNLYREWFVKFRFPGHQNAQFTKSSLGRIPEGWEIKALAELVNTQYGYTEAAQEKPIGPKYLRGMDINKTSYIDWDAVPYCPIPEDEYPKYQLTKGDIVIIRMADPGKVGIVEKDETAVFASYLVRLSRKTDRIGPYYLFHFLISDKYQGYITGASTGTTRKSASAGVLTGIDLLLPPESILREFESQVQNIRQLLNNLLARNTNLRRTRDLLLPRLISGEVDVSDLDIAVPEVTLCSLEVLNNGSA